MFDKSYCSPRTLLSDQCVITLQAATAAACVEALKAAPPSELWTLVLSVVNPIIRDHAQKHMERVSYIARLPDELLLRIFECLPVLARVCAATVCQRWRTVSLDAVAALWSDIPNLRNVQTYDFLLTRARDAPVTLAYAPAGLEDLGMFCGMLSDELERIKGLELILPEPCHDDELVDSAEYLHYILETRAPILESLVLSDPGMMYSRVYDHVPLIGSPMLRSLELEGFDLSYLKACADSPVLRALEISTPETYETLLLEDWSRISGLPALESLALHLPNVLAAEIPVHSPCPSVQHLRLKVHPAFLDVLCTIEDISRFRTLYISFLRPFPDIRQLAELLPFLQETTIAASVYFSYGYFNVLAADSAGRTRVFCNINVDDDWYAMLPNVRTLWLGVESWQSERAAAVFPALEELALDATNSLSPVFFAPRVPAWPPLSCPRLRVAQLISETPREPLPADEVLAYLRRTLGSSASPQRRLETLLLDGVTLSPAPDSDLAAAQAAVAENVEMVRSGQVPPESYRVWANPW